jgi:hypothetical protein
MFLGRLLLLCLLFTHPLSRLWFRVLGYLLRRIYIDVYTQGRCYLYVRSEQLLWTGAMKKGYHVRCI